MSLLRTELMRFWSRRLVWVTVVVVAGITAFGVAIAFTQHSKDQPAESGAIAQAQRATDSCLESFRFDLPESERASISHGFGIDPDDDAAFEAVLGEEICYQDPSWFRHDDRFFATQILLESFQSPHITDWSVQRPDSSVGNSYFGDSFGGEPQIRSANEGLIGILPSVAIFYLVVAVLVGASFVGAEYRSGTVENLLLWEPRRARVLLTKFVAGFGSSVVLTYLLLVWLTALLYLLAITRGTTQGVDGRFWIDVASTSGRGALMGGLFFVASMSVSLIARHTTAAVGVILGWFVVSNLAIELFAQWLREWELFTNAIAFIREGDGSRYQDFRGFSQLVYAHGYVKAGFIAAVWALVLSAFALRVFVRRDID